MAAYRLTVRHGPNVERESFETVDEAVDALERRAEAVRREGPLTRVNTLRDYEPGQRVHARLELSTGGVLRGREAGIDVMGDGALVPYVGVIRKRRLEPSRDRSAFDAVREALTG
ncbi:MAG TPA: hypothetical protein VN458_08355 [Solirubrobacterales bacterium]|nr:hypothetical protein [Solirubrobacterales bacterium]